METPINNINSVGDLNKACLLYQHKLILLFADYMKLDKTGLNNATEPITIASINKRITDNVNSWSVPLNLDETTKLLEFCNNTCISSEGSVPPKVTTKATVVPPVENNETNKEEAKKGLATLFSKQQTEKKTQDGKINYVRKNKSLKKRRSPKRMI